MESLEGAMLRSSIIHAERKCAEAKKGIKLRPINEFKEAAADTFVKLSELMHNKQLQQKKLRYQRHRQVWLDEDIRLKNLSNSIERQVSQLMISIGAKDIESLNHVSLPSESQNLIESIQSSLFEIKRGKGGYNCLHKKAMQKRIANLKAENQSELKKITEVEKNLSETINTLSLSFKIFDFELECNPWLQFDSQVKRFSELKYCDDVLNVQHQNDYEK